MVGEETEGRLEVCNVPDASGASATIEAISGIPDDATQGKLMQHFQTLKQRIKECHRLNEQVKAKVDLALGNHAKGNNKPQTTGGKERSFSMAEPIYNVLKANKRIHELEQEIAELKGNASKDNATKANTANAATKADTGNAATKANTGNGNATSIPALTKGNNNLPTVQKAVEKNGVDNVSTSDATGAKETSRYVFGKL